MKLIPLCKIVTIIVLCGFAECSMLGDPVGGIVPASKKVSYYFSATIDEDFSYFSTADTIDGILTYGDSIFTASADAYMVRQNAPLAYLTIRYKQKTTNKTVEGKTDEKGNTTADFTARVENASWDATTFRYENITTGLNDLFVAKGMDFGLVMFRFKNQYTPGTADLTTLEPTYLTLGIFINDQEYGPNFSIDTMYRVTNSTLLDK